VATVVQLRPAHSKTIKRCSCGACYTEQQWESLPIVGDQGDDVEDIELRNCTCGSTIAIVVGALFRPPQVHIAGL